MTDRTPILLVEDEPHIAQGVIFNLVAEGYQVSHAESAEEALVLLRERTFALAILDLALPEMDGLQLCRLIRQHYGELPVMMLTARSEDQDRIAGLSEGADDYLTKPFNLKEFLLRIANLLRRSQWQEQHRTKSSYRFGNNYVDLQGQNAETDVGRIDLTELEVKILRLFFTRQGKIISRGELLESVWGLDPETETRTLDNFIVRLRKYFENDPAKPRHFLTVRGRGYRFIKNPEGSK